MKPLFAILLAWPLLLSGLAAAASSPSEMISDFRLKHGEGRVTMDATLNRIALEQAKAMAAKDKLDHEVLGSFNSRIAPARAGRAAENIAYGYDGFEKTLGQWIDSSGHRKNLLLPRASRVGVASAKSATSPPLLGDGDRRRIRAPAKSCGQDNAACSQKKAGCSILPPQAPQPLLLMQAAMPAPRSVLHRTGFLSADGAVEGVDQGLDFGEFDAGPLGLVAIERSREHLGMRVPVFDHPLAGFL